MKTNQETFIRAGGHDCLGNCGTIKTDRDFYVADIYEPEDRRWWQQSSGKRGQLTIKGKTANFQPA